MTSRIEIGDGWIDVSDSLDKQVMAYAKDNDVTPSTAYQEVLGIDTTGEEL